MVSFSFNLEIMLIKKIPFFGRINAIGDCLDFQIQFHFWPSGSFFRLILILCYLFKEKTPNLIFIVVLYFFLLSSWAVMSHVCFILKRMVWVSLYPRHLPNLELEIIFYNILFLCKFYCQFTDKLRKWIENRYWLPR